MSSVELLTIGSVTSRCLSTPVAGTEAISTTSCHADHTREPGLENHSTLIVERLPDSIYTVAVPVLPTMTEWRSLSPLAEEFPEPGLSFH